MKTLVVGASGATGQLLVEELLKTGQHVKVIVRPTAKIPDTWLENGHIHLIQSNIDKMAVQEMADHLGDCHAIASCLGHNPSLKGVFGNPKKLVARATRLMCEAIITNKLQSPTKFVLMNTAGNRNRDLNESVSLGQKIMLVIIRTLLPPHRDNEAASDYLRQKIGQNHPLVQWVVVRPDTLIDENQVTDYSLHISPTRSAIFDPGKSSRINVGNFMARLVADDNLWNKWKGKMPVIYNITK